jgi:YVTN family beta-propeller protein
MGNNLSTAEDAITKGKMEAAKKEIGKSGARLYVINYVKNKKGDRKAVVSVIDADTHQIITTIKVGLGCFADYRDFANRLVLNAAGTRLYVTCYYKWFGWVSVIDTNTHKIVAQIDVGEHPGALVLNLAQTKLYVANQEGDTVTVIHTDTWEKVTICVSKTPVALLLNAAGTRLYVVNYKSDNITVIDADTYQVIATILVGNHPSHLVLNAEENRLYVANEGSNTIYIIDAVTHQVIAIIDVGRAPGALVLNSAETQLYVANFDDGTISVIDTDTHTHQVTTIRTVRSPRHLVLNSIDTDTHTHQVTTIRTVRSPRHLILNSAENCLYVNSRDRYTNKQDNDEVIFIDAITYQKIATISVSVRAKTRAYPVALVLNAAKTRLYVVNSMGENIFVIDTAAHRVIAIIDVGECPEAIAIREGSVIGDEVRFRSLSCNTIA